MINFVVNVFTITFTLLIKHRKTQYTFLLTLSHYNQTPKMKIAQISIFHYTFTFLILISHLHLFLPLLSNQTGSKAHSIRFLWENWMVGSTPSVFHPFSVFLQRKRNWNFVDVLSTSAPLFLFSENCKQVGFWILRENWQWAPLYDLFQPIFWVPNWQW